MFLEIPLIFSQTRCLCVQIKGQFNVRNQDETPFKGGGLSFFLKKDSVAGNVLNQESW